MPWHLTRDLTEFTAAAGEFLRGDPVRNTVPLTVLAALQHSGLAAYGDAPPFFGWHQAAGGQVNGALLRTPPHPLVVASLPAGSGESLLTQLPDRDRPAAISLPDDAAAEFGSAWAAVTGGRTQVRIRMRLFRLAGLRPPDPGPPGAARITGQSDFSLLAGWAEAFRADTGTGAGDAARDVREHLSYGGITIWEDAGPAAMASLSRHVAGVCRVSGVYTPPELRQRGYGGAITSAVSQQALDAGAAEVVLYTDLANPTSNALYQRLGYRPVGDRIELGLL